jgi:hypothetical protein
VGEGAQCSLAWGFTLTRAKWYVIQEVRRVGECAVVLGGVAGCLSR